MAEYTARNFPNTFPSQEAREIYFLGSAERVLYASLFKAKSRGSLKIKMRTGAGYGEID